MTDRPIDISEDEYLRSRPRSVAEDLDGVTEPAFADLDQPQIPASARQHAARYDAATAEAKRAADLQVVDQAAQADADALALAKVHRLRKAKKPVPPQLLARAARAARAQGRSMSSSELLAARAGR
jgi:hypothetical protein